jgi:hypothetical protein
MTKPTSGIAWLTERVTLLAQLNDRALGMIEQLTANQKSIGDTLRVQRESIAELDKKCDRLYGMVKSIELLGGRP